MSKRRLFAVSLCSAAVMSMGTTAALAGEIGGNGQETPIGVAGSPESGGTLHAHSICSFSGLNDEFVNGVPGAPRTQHPAPGDLHGSPNACQGRP